MHLRSCRECGDEFTFALPSGEEIVVIAGIPLRGTKYTAVSYVWGDVQMLKLACGNCSATLSFPMASVSKLGKLLALGHRGTHDIRRVWLDALSINQADHADIARQIAVMGNIYREAAFVSVLLPSEDLDAFGALEQLVSCSKMLYFERRDCFENNNEPLPKTGNGSKSTNELEDMPTSELCRSYLDSISSFRQVMLSSTYWSRAWTFQEWAMAKDIHVEHEESRPETRIENAKSTVLLAILMLARYKLSLPEQELKVNIGLSRQSVPTVMRIVGSLFPNFDLFKADTSLRDPSSIERLISKIEVDSANSTGVNSDLSGDLSNFKTLLCLMLNAFGLHRRNARFEADLVCCWASMCNISYPYSRDDSLARSLQKVVGAIRRRGIRLYNFTVNTEGAGLEVDLLFLDHAAFYTPRVTTLDVAGALEAALFSGAIVTELHLHNTVSCREPHPALAGAGVAVSPVANARIASLSLLSDIPAFNAHFEGGIVEQWGVPGAGQERHAWGYGFALDDDGVYRGNDFSLTVVEVDVHDSNVAGKDSVRLWAICPARFGPAHLFVAVETINRTLVLVAHGGHDGQERAVAYLTSTDSSRISRVVEVDAAGRLAVMVERTVWSDPRKEMVGPDRFVFEGKVALSEQVLPVL